MGKGPELLKSVTNLSSSVDTYLQKVTQSRYVILQSHAVLLRAAVAFACGSLRSEKDFPKTGLVDLEAEMHKIIELLWIVSPEDISSKNQEENSLVLALRTLKSMVLLSKLRIDVGQATLRLLNICNELGFYGSKVQLMNRPDFRDTYIDETSIDLLLSNIPNIPSNLTINNAADEDTNRIATVFNTVKTVVDNNISSINAQSQINKLMNDLGKVSKSKKVGKLLTGPSLKSSPTFLSTVDDELIRIVYGQKIAPDQFQANYKNPKPNDVLGNGVYGPVILGTFYGSRTAVKRLPLKTLSAKVSTQGRHELISELKNNWKNIDNPNLVKFYGTITLDDSVFILLENLDMSLGDMLHRYHYTMESDEMSSCAMSILRGLKFLHQNSIIHGDLNPVNVIIGNVLQGNTINTSRMEVKLGDFGMRKLKRDLHLSNLFDNNQALTTLVEQLRVYQAPEVLTENKWTFAADIYSFALTCWEMGENNEKPFKDVKDLNSVVVEGNARPQLDKSKLSDWLKKIVQQSWEREPSRRPTSSELLRTVEHNMAAVSMTVHKPQAIQLSNRMSNSVDKRRAKTMVQSLAIPEESWRDSKRTESSNMSSIRRSVRRSSNRMSMNARTSVILQKQKFLFLDEVDTATDISVGIKVIKTMKNYLGDAEVQLRGINAIRLLALTPGNEYKLMKMGAGKAILEAMRSHPFEPAIQEPGCGGICNLCYHAENARALMRSGALSLVIKAMKTHSGDPFVVEEGLQALTNLHSGDIPRQAILITRGAADTIVECMKMHPNHPRVQEEAFAAIAYLQPGFLHYNQTLTNMTKKRSKRTRSKDFFEMNAHREIIESMKTLSEESGVQIEGCAALKALVILNDASRKLEILKYGVLEAVKKAMKTFELNAAVQESACSLLSVMAIPKESKTEMLRLELDIIILNAMIRHRTYTDEVLQVRAVFTIFNWCYGSKKVSNKFKKNGAIKVIGQAVKLFPENETLQSKARDAAKVINKGGKL